jgi:hypothetical protein
VFALPLFFVGVLPRAVLAVALPAGKYENILHDLTGRGRQDRQPAALGSEKKKNLLSQLLY